MSVVAYLAFATLLIGSLACGGGISDQNDPNGKATSAPVAYLFLSSSATDGLPTGGGGRAGMDSICEGEVATALPDKTCDSVHALISVSDSDEIRDMPNTFGLPSDASFRTKSEAVIADDFADLLDGALDQSLLDTGDFGAVAYWTGSNPNGALSADHCDH